MDIEESYLVRISRHAPPRKKINARHGHSRTIGVVENPATGQRRAFHDIEELWAVLADSSSPGIGAQAKTGSHRKVTDP